jgi:hypothetical protein
MRLYLVSVVNAEDSTVIVPATAILAADENHAAQEVRGLLPKAEWVESGPPEDVHVWVMPFPTRMRMGIK